jgi:hypothetical protein
MWGLRRSLEICCNKSIFIHKGRARIKCSKNLCTLKYSSKHVHQSSQATTKERSDKISTDREEKGRKKM